MHAASVHPEPGSNSRIVVSKISQRRSQIFIRAWLLFTFCLSSISLRIVEFRSRTHTWISPCSMLVLSSCCSIFNDRFRYPFLWAAWPLYHTVFLLSSTFSKFFQLFRKLFWRSPSKRQLAYSTTLFRLCQGLFWNFFRFLFSFLGGGDREDKLMFIGVFAQTKLTIVGRCLGAAATSV